MMEQLETGLHAAGYTEIRSAHFPVAQALFQHPEGARNTQLAAWTHLKKQSIGELVDYLEAHGYVRRLPEPHDRRAHRIQLTERGTAMGRTVRSLVRQVEEEWVHVLGISEFSQLRHHLQTLVAWLQHEE
jgi:DNA-binding MarR family transcriptional regulator